MADGKGPSRLAPMKTKALILSALILVPTAGAAAVQAAPAPAQDFRVSYTTSAVATAPSIFSKTNLPQVLSDEELDGVTGEGPVAGAISAIYDGVTGALAYGGILAATGQKGNARDAILAVVVPAAFGFVGGLVLPTP